VRIRAALALQTVRAHIAHTVQGSIIPALDDVPGRAALPEGEARRPRETQLRARNRRAPVLEDCRRDVAVTLDRLR
jgi:hypothetical protein